MAASRAAARSRTKGRSDGLQTFVWEGTDKRGVTMKGEQPAKSANLVRAELRRQGINPKVVKPKPKPLFGSAGKRVTPLDIAMGMERPHRARDQPVVVEHAHRTERIVLGVAVLVEREVPASAEPAAFSTTRRGSCSSRSSSSTSACSARAA